MSSSTPLPPSTGRLNPNSLQYCETQFKHTDQYAEGKVTPSPSDFNFVDYDQSIEIQNRLNIARLEIGDHSLYDVCVSNFHSRQGANADYSQLFQQSLHPLQHRLACVSGTDRTSVPVGTVLKEELAEIRHEAVLLHNRITLQSMYPERYPMESPVVYAALHKASEGMKLLHTLVTKEAVHCFDTPDGNACISGNLLKAVDVLSTPTGHPDDPLGSNDQCSPAKLGPPPDAPANLQVLKQLIAHIDLISARAGQAARTPGL